MAAGTSLWEEAGRAGKLFDRDSVVDCGEDFLRLAAGGPSNTAGNCGSRAITELCKAIGRGRERWRPHNEQKMLLVTPAGIIVGVFFFPSAGPVPDPK